MTNTTPASTNSNDIIPFKFEGSEVRVIDQAGDPWWVLADVCSVLDIANVGNANARLDDDEKDDIRIMDAIGRQQETAIINESGLWSLVLTSRKPSAKRFKKWITSEVIPSIRKTGGYTATPDPAAFLNDPSAMRAALLGYTEKVIALEAEKAENQPKLAALEQLASKEGLFGFRVAAYLVGWTQNRFIDRVHEVGWTHTPKDWQIHAHIAKAGYMKYRSVERHHRDGEAFVKHQPMFTARGLAKIAEIIGEMPGDENKKVQSLCNAIDDINGVLEEGWTKEGNDWFIDNPGPKRALQLIKRLVKTLPSTKAETAARNRILKEFTLDEPDWFIAKILWGNQIRQEIKDKFAAVNVPFARIPEPAS